MALDKTAVWLHDIVEHALSICIPLIELLALLIIVGYSLSTVYRFCRSQQDRQSSFLNERLGRGLSLGLGLYLASEILQTALIKDYQDFAMITLLVLLRTAIAWLLQRSTAPDINHPETSAEGTPRYTNQESAEPLHAVR